MLDNYEIISNFVRPIEMCERGFWLNHLIFRALLLFSAANFVVADD